MLWHPKNPAKSCYVQCFFHFWPFFPLPESYQNDPKFHFNTLLRSDTQKSSKMSKTPPYSGLGAKPFLGPPPPPPAKADIADCYINKCHWAFSVAVLPPNKHCLHRQSGVGGFQRYFEYRVPHFQTDLWQDAWPGPSLPGACVVAPQRAMCSSGARWAEGHGSQGGPEGAEHLEKSWSWNTHVVKHM